MQFRIGERLASVLTLVLFLVAGPAYAQQTESRIIGRVLDSSKAALPGVTVTVTSKDTGATREAVTDADGSYVITNLGPGAYVVSVELAGFQTQRREVVLGVGPGRNRERGTGRGRRGRAGDGDGRRAGPRHHLGADRRQRLAGRSRRTCRSTAATSRT